MNLDRKNPGIGDIVLLKWNGTLYPLLIGRKTGMIVDGWIFMETKIVPTPLGGFPFGDEEGQWRMKE